MRTPMDRASKATCRRGSRDRDRRRRAPYRGWRACRGAGHGGWLRMASQIGIACSYFLLAARLCEGGAGAGGEPECHDEGSDREADREGDAEKLCGREVGQARCGEEDAHDRGRSRDAEQDGDGAQHPALLLRAIAYTGIHEGAIEREEKERVEEENGGALQPSADGISAH